MSQATHNYIIYIVKKLMKEFLKKTIIISKSKLKNTIFKVI